MRRRSMYGRKWYGGLLIGLLLCVCRVHAYPVDKSYSRAKAYEKLLPDYPQISVAVELPDRSVRVLNNQIYRDDIGRALALDVYLPASRGLHPTVLLVHGGAWRSGSRSLLAPLAAYLARQGYIAALVEYRLSPEARYPAGMEDLVAALDWLRREGKTLGVDAGRVAVLGCSSGAQMATLLGVTAGLPLNDLSWRPGNAAVQAIVNIDGIVSFTTPLALKYENDPTKNPSAAEAWLGGRYEAVPGRWHEASPLAYAGPGSPPTLFVNGAAPRFHAGRDAYLGRLTRGKVATQVVTLDDAPHSFWLFNPWFEPTARAVQGFLDEVL